MDGSVMSVEDYTEEEFTNTLARNFRSLIRGKKSRGNPIAILLGGQSGAGKTTIHRIKQREFKGNIIIIDGDSFRTQHPHCLKLQQNYGKDSVEYTKQFAGQMVEYLVDGLSDSGFHLLVEGPLRTVEVPRRTAELLRKKGYSVQLALIATKPKLSFLSTLIRYEELRVIDTNQARATPKKYHDFIVNSLVENTRQLEKSGLFDRIQIYQRDRNCVYDSEDSGDMSVATMLNELLFGEWNQAEDKMLRLGEKKLKELKENNDGDS